MLKLSRISSAWLVGVVILCASPFARASILTFAVDRANGNGAMPQDYGDRIIDNNTDATPSAGAGTNHTYDASNGATPNVVVAYSSPDTSFLYYREAGVEWPAVAYLLNPNNTTLGTFDLLFTPDAGYGVRINSFVLDDYAAYASGSSASWTIYDGVNTSGPVLASSGGSVSLTNGQNLTQSTGLVSYNNGPVLLRVIHQVGTRDDLALDNLSFNQQLLPEPMSATILAFGALVSIRRRTGARERYERWTH
jgi:hypothetical protein